MKTKPMIKAGCVLALLAGLGVASAEVEFKPYGNAAKAPDNDSVRRAQSAEKQLQAERQRTADLERQLREAKAAKKDKPTETLVKPKAALKQDAPAATVTVPEDPVWVWPTTSKVVRTVSAYSDSGKGLDFPGQVGEPVFAASDGKVDGSV